MPALSPPLSHGHITNLYANYIHAMGSRTITLPVARARVYSGNTRINLRRIDSRVSPREGVSAARPQPHAHCAYAASRTCGCRCRCRYICARARSTYLPPCERYAYARTYVNTHAHGNSIWPAFNYVPGLPLTSNFPNTAIIAVIIMARAPSTSLRPPKPHRHHHHHRPSRVSLPPVVRCTTAIPTAQPSFREADERERGSTFMV